MVSDEVGATQNLIEIKQVVIVARSVQVVVSLEDNLTKIDRIGEKIVVEVQSYFSLLM